MEEECDGGRMRTLFISGSTALLIALMTANANAVEANSPYATMTPSGTPLPAMEEGRAAYEQPRSVYGRPGNDFGPGFDRGAPDSPYKWATPGLVGGFPGTEFTR